MLFHHAILLRHALRLEWSWTQVSVPCRPQLDKSWWFRRCYSLRADTIHCGLRIDFGTPQVLVTRNESYHPDGWLTWVVPLLEQYVWPRQRRRAGWLAYRNFMDNIDWNKPVAPMPLEAAQFDTYGGLLEPTGRLRVQGIDALTFSAICARRYPVHHIQSRSFVVLMRRWSPKETHYCKYYYHICCTD
ncbi:hypothetical protein IWQ61_002113 [Dispira simplex]|nr:hypothetical protein IWQ61_002113 [Dispira simplex]